MKPRIPEGDYTVAFKSYQTERFYRGGAPKLVINFHVIDRGGRHAGIFHGAAFRRINLVLYINGRTNAPPPEPGLLDRLFGAFR